MTYRYFLDPGGRYHELRIRPAHTRGDVVLTVLKDRGNRSESITVRASDIERVCAEIGKAAHEGDAR